MNNLLPEEETTKKAYDKNAQAWVDSTKLGAHYDWQPELHRFHQLLPRGSVLEIGMGNGEEGVKFLEMGYKYVGTDISKNMLKIARKKLPKQQLFLTSVHDLSFSEKFDGFWACAVLLHIPKLRMSDALKRIKSVIKTGAIGFISLKDGQGEGLQRDIIGGAVFNRYFSYWSKTEFANLLKESGFDIIDYHYQPVSEKTRWHCFFVKNI